MKLAIREYVGLSGRHPKRGKFYCAEKEHILRVNMRQ